jgi:CubicO group peptidase (beta-lactamase class C family)
MKSIILSLSFCVVCYLQAANDRLDEVVQYSVAGKRFMGSVLVARGDAIVLDNGYGFASLEPKLPNDPATKFRIGSLTKQFTAVGILLLEEQGKLHLEDPIKNYLPDAPAAWGKITFFQLLTHSSGIPDLIKFPEYNAAKKAPASAEELVAYFRDKPLEFQPGEKSQYSNSGFILLGYLLERISGQSYAEFLRKNIFEPAGMLDSGYDSNLGSGDRRAVGHKTGPQGIIPAEYIDMTRVFSAGGLYSTSHDLVRWQRVLYEGKLLRPESLKKMTTPIKNGPGLGIGVAEFLGQKSYHHSGGIEGFRSDLGYFPETRTSVIVLSNLEEVGVSDITPKLARVVFGQTIILPTERPAIALPPEKLAEYVGAYEVSPEISVVISLEGEQLFVEVVGQLPKAPLFAASERKFFLRSEDSVLEFLSDQKGAITSLVAKRPGEPQVKAVRKR